MAASASSSATGEPRLARGWCGSIERGPALAGGQASRPLQLEDGTILFLDAGKLRAVDRSLQAWELAELLAIPPGETWRYSGALSLEGSTLSVVLNERTPDTPIESRTSCWSLEVLRPGE